MQHSHVCAHRDTNTQKQAPHAEVDAHSYTDVSTQTCPCSPVQAHTLIGKHAHRDLCTQMHTHTRTSVYSRLCTGVHTHVHVPSQVARKGAQLHVYTHTDITANLPVRTPIHKHTHVHLVLHMCVSSRWQAGDSTPPVTQLCRAWGWAQPHLSPLLGGEEEVSWAWGAPGAPPVGRTCSAQGRIPSLCAAPCCSRLPRVGPGRGSGEGLRGRTLTPGWELAVLPLGQGEGFAVKVTTPLLF